MSDAEKIRAARSLVAQTLITTCAQNLRECMFAESIVQECDQLMRPEWESNGEFIIKDPALRIPGEQGSVALHVYLARISSNYVPAFSVPDDKFAASLRNIFATFRSASESFWKEAQDQSSALPALRAVSETIYEFVNPRSGDDRIAFPWRVGVCAYFVANSGRKYRLSDN